jgi:serine/threonine protein phosphatase PrpC
MFDGHNGAAAAEWMAKEMPARLDALADPCEHKALTACVEQADADFMEDTNVRVHGCTACLVLIRHGADGKQRKLTVANVGDSRCLVFGMDGKVKFTTEDHKPDTESEGARIRAAGGSVSFGRVDGDLAMSRSIGDHAYKNVPGVAPLAQKVVPTPDVSDVELDPRDIVLVCCDGLVEKLSNAQVAQYIVEHLAAQKAELGEEDIDPAATMCGLLEHSLARGSKDNMSSALYVPAPPSGSGYGRADEYLVGPFSEWAGDRGFVDAFFADARRHGLDQEAAIQLVNAYNERKQKGGPGADQTGALAQKTPAA